MKQLSSNRAKALQFDRGMADQIFARDDYSCLFCKRNYRMPENMTMVELQIKDPMHFIPKSHGGLGIRKNGGCGCRYHHHMYDHSPNEQIHNEMTAIFADHLKEVEPGWDQKDLVYIKTLREPQMARKKTKPKKDMQMDIFGGEIECDKIEKPKLKRATMKDLFRAKNGYKEGYKCRNCVHFKAMRANRIFYKCEILGISSSIATDIRKNEVACNRYEE